MSDARTIDVGGRQGRGDPLATCRLRTFRVECLAAGEPFNWQGDAANEADAFRQAAEAMVNELPWVHAREVQQTACIELTRPELATFGKQLQRGDAELLLIVLAAAMALATAAAGAIALDAASCHARWGGSATPTRYGLLAGCQVLRGGRWIPESVVRDLAQ